MFRLFCLGALVAVSGAPAVAQSGALLRAVDAASVPVHLAYALTDSEVGIHARLGMAAREVMVPAEFDEGPPRPGLEFRLRDGQHLTLAFCSESDRQQYADSADRTFCLARWTRPLAEGEAPMDTHQSVEDVLRVHATEASADCDQWTFVFDSVLASADVDWVENRLEVTLEPLYAPVD